VILPKIYSEKGGYIEGLGSISSQEFPGLKQLVLCKIDFEVVSVNFIDNSLKLDRLYLSDCLFQDSSLLEALDEDRQVLHTKTLYIGSDRSSSMFDYIFPDINLKDLIILYPKWDNEMYGGLNISIPPNLYHLNTLK